MATLEDVLSPEGIEVAGRTQPLKFENSTDLEVWLKKEAEEWEGLYKAANSFNLPAEIGIAACAPYERLNEAASHVGNAYSHSSDAQIKARKILDAVLTEIADGSIPISGSADFKKIQRLSEEDLRAAGGLLLVKGHGFVLGTDRRGRSTDVASTISAMVSGMLADVEVKRTRAAETAAFKELRSKLEKEAESTAEAHQKLVNRITEDIEDAATATKHNMANQLARFDAAEKEFKEWTEERHSELQALQDLLSTKLATDDAVKLWTDAAGRHKSRATGALVAFAILGVLGVFGIVFGFDFVVERLERLSVPKGETGIGVPGGIATSVILSFPILAVAWGMRLASRSFVQALHSRQDAEIRAALTKTYLNLAADNNSDIDDAERILILNALFRPLGATSDDDTMPPNLVDALTKSRGVNA